METVVLILMVLICFNFVLKQTFQGPKTQAVISIICFLTIVLSVPFAIEQSKTQIREWLMNPSLMLDTSVVLFIDVFLQIGFVMFAARLMTSGKEKKAVVIGYKLLRYFPGLLIFPVLFYTLTQLIFTFTGTSFELIGVTFGALTAVAIPVAARMLRRLLPEKEIRLELLFLINLLIAIIGVVATVNGRTAVAGVSDVNFNSLGGVIVIAITGIAAGFLLGKLKIKRSIKKISKL